MDYKTLAKLYNSQANFYDLSRFGSRAGKYAAKIEEKYILNLLKVRGKILEVGCGTGKFAKLAKNGYYVGIDIAPSMLEVARNKHEQSSWLLMNGEELGFRSNTFDAILVVRVFKFFKNPKKFLSEARRVLKEGGNLIILYENRDVIWRRRKLISKFGEKYYSTKEMESMLTTCGFKIYFHKKVALSPHVLSKYIPDLLNLVLLKISQKLSISFLYTNSIIVGELHDASA